MSVPPDWPQVLDFFGTSLVLEPSAGQLSGDARLLPIRQFDRRIGLTQAFAQTLDLTAPGARLSLTCPRQGLKPLLKAVCRSNVA
jgi:hypothetical protein